MASSKLFNVKLKPAERKALAKSTEVGDACLRRAREIQRAAESLAPRVTGAYANSFESTRIVERVNGQERAAARVTNTDGAAAAIEFGNRHVAGQRVLGRAAQS